MRTRISRDSAMRIEINHNFLVELCNALTLKVDGVPDAGDNYPICGVSQYIKTQWVNVSKRWVNVSVAKWNSIYKAPFGYRGSASRMLSERG